MDVKSGLLPKSVQGPSPAPKSQSQRDTDEQKKLSTDVSPASSPPSAELRTALIGELLNSETEINRYYDGTVSGWTTTDVTTSAGGAVTISAIPQGTGAGQRLGNTVRAKRLRLRVHLRPGQSFDPGSIVTGIPADVEYSYAMRLVVGIDKMPVIGTPSFVDASTWNIGATYPFSAVATHTNPRAGFVAATTVYPGMIHLVTRNPQTLKRYEIIHDEVYNISDKYPSFTDIQAAGATTVAEFFRTASKWVDLTFHFKDLLIQWYDQANNASYFQNRLFFMVLADAPAAGPGRFKWMSEIEFENVA